MDLHWFSTTMLWMISPGIQTISNRKIFQTFVLSKDFCAFMLKLSWIHQSFVRSCSDPRAFARLSCARQFSCILVQTFVAFNPRIASVHLIFARSCLDFSSFTRLSCFQVKTFVGSRDFCAFTDLPCAHVKILFQGSPDFRAFVFWNLCVRQTFLPLPVFVSF